MTFINKIKEQPVLYLLSLSCLVFYFSFAYDLVRTDYVKLITLYAGLFILSYKLYQIARNKTRFLIGITVLFRLAFLFAVPNLSQDFYRFIWDGRMIIEGLNPYLYTPMEVLEMNGISINQGQELVNGMGALSAGNHSNYPPLKQFIFWLAALVSGKSILGSVVVMRTIIIAADIGVLYFGQKLLKAIKLPGHRIYWYLLNPFIIIELTGNLHFEGIMIFFLVWSLYLIHQNKWYYAAMVLACSVSIKLIPLIFLPLFLQRLGIIKSLGLYGIVGVLNLLLFTPFYSSELVKNYSETVGLWFQKFEFNASLYYIAREIGYTFRGYNEIAIIGSYIPYIVLIFVLLMSLLRSNKTMVKLSTAMLLCLSFYFFTATTVHPWYIATLVVLGIFTRYRFALIWSLVIVLSYLAYLNINKADKSENLWIIAIEYLVVYGVLLWELFSKKHLSNEHINYFN